MRALFTTQSTLSHWHQLVPLAQAVEQAGHEVAFTALPRFRQTIEAQGFRTFLAGSDETPEERRQRREQMAGLNPEEDTIFTLRKVFAGVMAERSLPAMLDLMRDWLPDIVVHENTEFAGCVAAERAGIPHAVVQITAPWLFYLDAVEPPVMRLCASVGLSPATLPDLLYHYLLLFPRPLSLWDPSVPLPITTHAYRYAGFSQSGEEGLPPWVAELQERSTVYATLGTFENRMTEILAAILEGLRDEPINLILTVGRNRDPQEFGPQPPNVHVERYIPQSLLLPHCDLVLCHGGSGTVMDALSLGLPLVLIPIAADQPENAKRCKELGVARVIEPDQLPPADLAKAIRDATRDVLSAPHYREAAQRLQSEIEGLPWLDQVVTLLERLAAERAPLPAEPAVD